MLIYNNNLYRYTLLFLQLDLDTLNIACKHSLLSLGCSRLWLSKARNSLHLMDSMSANNPFL